MVHRVMATSITADANALLFEERTSAPRYRNTLILLWVLCAIAGVLILSNVKTGILFYFDDAKRYIRGPMAWMTYFLMVVDMAVMLTVYLKERDRARHTFIRVALLLPPLIILISVLQTVFPNTPFSGTLGALALTVLFINGQQQRMYTDHLTNLISREIFYKLLDQYAKRGVLFHVVIVSLVDYKSVNNRFGQRIGDGFLRAVGDWMGRLQKKATTCRYSGVAFAMIVRDMDVADYETLIQTLAKRFEQPWEYDGNRATLNVAIADIAYPGYVSNVNELISSLEYAMRLAKRGESGGIVRFNKQLRNRMGRRDYVLSQLELALEEDRYFVEFQPIYEFGRRRTVGAEALCRMHDSTGVIMPGEFIPLAEESGLVTAIDRVVLEKTCAFLSQHPDCGLEWISVNIAGMEYASPEAREWLYALLERYQLGPGRIRLEITERTLIKDMEGARVAAEILRSHGVGLSMDDFGIGYSNLFNVTHMPLDCVKMDKSLVDHVEHDSNARMLLASVVQGVKSLGMHVLAEGVETESQMGILEQMGADMVQGYYHARPMSGPNLIKLLEHERTFHESLSQPST